MIDLGQLDLYGHVYSRSPVIKAGGAVSYTEAFFSEIYLTKVRVPVVTAMVAQKDTEVADVIYKARWLEGLSNGMLLRVEGETYRIVRRDELGRKEGWQIYAKTHQ
jgi:hypothetical protein